MVPIGIAVAHTLAVGMHGVSVEMLPARLPALAHQIRPIELDMQSYDCNRITEMLLRPRGVQCGVISRDGVLKECMCNTDDGSWSHVKRKKYLAPAFESFF